MVAVPMIDGRSRDHGRRELKSAQPKSQSIAPNANANTGLSTAHREFTSLFSEHAPHIWRAVRGLGVRDADIEDVCQDVFVVVHRKLPTFEARSSVRTWIYGIALRVVADYRKKAYRVRERLSDSLPEVVTQATQERTTAHKQAWQTLDSLLATLSEDRRQVFVLYELEQLPMREVATIVECPLQTAYSRLEAAREIVQRGMDAWRQQERAR